MPAVLKPSAVAEDRVACFVDAHRRAGMKPSPSTVGAARTCSNLSFSCAYAI